MILLYYDSEQCIRDVYVRTGEVRSRHQLERFGVDYVPTSVYQPQSNGAADRLVATMKSILSSKMAGAARDWPALLPQIRMEYMQRVHPTTGYSPNHMVYATTPRLPPPELGLAWDSRSASASVSGVPNDTFAEVEPYLPSRNSRAR